MVNVPVRIHSPKAMPIDYSKYPADWKTVIRPRILARAASRCEKCGVENYAWLPAKCCAGPHYSDKDGFRRCLGCRKHRPRVVLTIAHLDHDITNNKDSNLAALCQRCHLTYDAKLHATNARKTREAKSGQMTLL